MINASQSYLVAQIQSATPGGLIVLLYDGLLRFTMEAEEYLAQKDHQALTQAARSVQRATDILTELTSCLRDTHEPKLCACLSSLYAFFTTELSRGLHSRNPEVLAGIVPLITELRDTWQEAELLASRSQSTSTSG